MRTDEDYFIVTVYKIKMNSDWISEYYGTWAAHGIVRSNNTQTSLVMRRKNLRQETIVTSMVVTDDRTISDLNDLR